MHPFALIDPQNWSQTSQHPWGWSFPLLDLKLSKFEQTEAQNGQIFKFETSGLTTLIAMLGSTGHVWHHWTSGEGQRKQKVTGKKGEQAWSQNNLGGNPCHGPKKSVHSRSCYAKGPKHITALLSMFHALRCSVISPKIAALPCLPLGWQHLWLQLHQPATKHSEQTSHSCNQRCWKRLCVWSFSSKLGITWSPEEDCQECDVQKPTAMELLTLKNFRVSCSTCFNISSWQWSCSNRLDFNSEV